MNIYKTKEVPRSGRMFEKNNRVEKKDDRSRAVVSALTFIKGTTNKFFVRTSIAVNTYWSIGDFC